MVAQTTSDQGEASPAGDVPQKNEAEPQQNGAEIQQNGDKLTNPEASTEEASSVEASPAEASPVEASPADASPAEASPVEASTVEASTAEGDKDGAQVKTVKSILAKIKADDTMKDNDKIDTLCLLLQKIIEENQLLKTELGMVSEQMDKSNQAKDAVKQLNVAYKKQIELVREENGLRLQEEASKRAECISNYQSTMGELSVLLETHTGQNGRLRDENKGMADQMTTLVQETEKRDKQIEAKFMEYKLQITLLEHKIQKAHLEKAEVKADMTKERLEVMQELGLERERNSNLDETLRLMKEQATIYQEQLDDLSKGAGTNSKSFQHFKAQIDKLTKQMCELDRDTQQWREKYEVSSQQVKKMNTQSLEREKEVGQLKKKLESMVKLNKTLSEERAAMNLKIKTLEKDT